MTHHRRCQISVLKTFQNSCVTLATEIQAKQPPMGGFFRQLMGFFPCRDDGNCCILVEQEVDRKAELLGKSVYPVGLVAFFFVGKR